MKFGFYCLCGGTMEGEVLPDDKVSKLREAWLVVHNKDREGCGETLEKKAKRIARKNEAAEIAAAQAALRASKGEGQ